MRKIDHVRKTVYIIVGCLTIVSLVLTICHKVGLCASSENSGWLENSDYYLVSDYPFPYGVGSKVGYGDFNLTVDYVNALITYNKNHGVASGYDGFICVYEVASDNSYIEFVEHWLSGNTANRFLLSTSSISTSSVGYSRFRVYNDFSVVPTVEGIEQSTVLSLSFWSDNQVPKNTYIFNYPVCMFNTTTTAKYDTLNFTSGSPCFSLAVSNNNGGTIISGHTKGGVLGNYIDSHDLIEDSSDLPEVDVTPPADPTTNNLLQKILNGLGILNGSIQSGVLTIGDYIGQGFENVINWFTEPFDSDQFNSDLNDIALINDFSNLKTQVETCGIFDWSDVTPAQSLSFTFDVGGAVLPHTSCVVDFSWYTGTVKNICVAVICTFLVLGLLVTIINQLPNIIGGKSGDKGGGSDS